MAILFIELDETCWVSNQGACVNLMRRLAGWKDLAINQAKTYLNPIWSLPLIHNQSLIFCGFHYEDEWALGTRKGSPDADSPRGWTYRKWKWFQLISLSQAAESKFDPLVLGSKNFIAFRSWSTFFTPHQFRWNSQFTSSESHPSTLPGMQYTKKSPRSENIPQSSQWLWK